jgi:hypothetical protein
VDDAATVLKECLLRSKNLFPKSMCSSGVMLKKTFGSFASCIFASRALRLPVNSVRHFEPFFKEQFFTVLNDRFRPFDFFGS